MLTSRWLRGGRSSAKVPKASRPFHLLLASAILGCPEDTRPFICLATPHTNGFSSSPLALECDVTCGGAPLSSAREVKGGKGPQSSYPYQTRQS